MKIILASKSPRRKQLMESVGFQFEVVSSDIDETIFLERDVTEEVKRLAHEKAKAVQVNYLKSKSEKFEIKDEIAEENKTNRNLNSNEETIIVAADTIVVVENEILGKPSNDEEARRMLKKLSGTTHRVLTGVSVMTENEEKNWCEISFVTFKVLTDEEINEYVETGSPMDKAGSYGIQEKGDKFVTRIEGDFDSIVGMPIGKVKETIDNLQ